MARTADAQSLPPCRHHEQALIDALYKRDTIPSDLAARFCATRSALLAAVADLSASYQRHYAQVDQTFALRFHEPCCLLSFYSSKIDLRRMKQESFVSSGVDLQQFEGAIAISKLRTKCFVSERMAEAQVRHS